MCTLISKMSCPCAESFHTSDNSIRVWKITDIDGVTPDYKFKYEMGQRYDLNEGMELVTVYTSEFEQKRQNNHSAYPELKDIEGVGVTSGRFHVFTDKFVKEYFGHDVSSHQVITTKDSKTGKPVERLLLMCRIPEGAFYEVGIGQSEGILTTISIEVADITGQFKEAV